MLTLQFHKVISCLTLIMIRGRFWALVKEEKLLEIRRSQCYFNTKRAKFPDNKQFHQRNHREIIWQFIKIVNMASNLLKKKNSLKVNKLRWFKIVIMKLFSTELFQILNQWNQHISSKNLLKTFPNFFGKIIIDLKS